MSARVVVSKKQARMFAVLIKDDIKKYIEEHKDEYERWLKNEQSQEEQRIEGKEIKD